MNRVKTELRMKKILVCSYFFHPEQAPRSFRTTELVKELSKRGHDITLIIPNYEYDLSSEFEGVKVEKVQTGFLFNRNDKIKRISSGTKGKSNSAKKKSSPFRLLLLRCFNIFESLFYIEGKRSEYTLPVFFKLLKYRKTNFDSVISIGLPFSSTFAIGLISLLFKKMGKIQIADYGDPFSYSPISKRSFIARNIEQQILKKFDYVTIPTDLSIPAYTKLVASNKIKIIPQGFNFEEIRIANYSKNHIPTFIFAGVFYEIERNPRELFDYLLSINIDFKFIIYTDFNNTSTMEILRSYEKELGEKLVVNDKIPRLDVITELSKCDFLLNINNISGVQAPSKLVDYTLSKRPIFEMTPGAFDPIKFDSFLHGNYSNSLSIDITSFNITNVTNQFLSLMNS